MEPTLLGILVGVACATPMLVTLRESARRPPRVGLGVVAATLLLQRHGYHAPGIKTDREVALLSEDEWQDVVNKTARVTGPHAHKALVLYDTTEEGSADVRDNVEFVMKTLSVRTVSLPETAFVEAA